MVSSLLYEIFPEPVSLAARAGNMLFLRELLATPPKSNQGCVKDHSESGSLIAVNAHARAPPTAGAAAGASLPHHSITGETLIIHHG